MIDYTMKEIFMCVWIDFERDFFSSPTITWVNSWKGVKREEFYICLCYILCLAKREKVYKHIEEGYIWPFPKRVGNLPPWRSSLKNIAGVVIVFPLVITFIFILYAQGVRWSISNIEKAAKKNINEPNDTLKKKTNL
jgi:hypothetical protein